MRHPDPEANFDFDADPDTAPTSQNNADCGSTLIVRDNTVPPQEYVVMTSL
jgi:hypothetical protein